MKHASFYPLPLVLMGCACFALPAWSAVTASLDRSQVSLGERVRLVIQSDGDSDGQPNVAALRQDFNILGSTQGSSTQIINGHISSQRQFTVFLEPTHEGAIKIGPIQWGSEQSPALVLSVGAATDAGKAAQDGPASTAPVAISATLDNKQPYVQGAVVMTLKVYVGVPMVQASLDLPSSSDVLVKQLGEDKQGPETRNGRNYQVIERKYVLIPQRSGKISLKGPVFEGQVQDLASIDGSDFDAFFGNVFGRSPLSRMMGGTRPVKLAASSIEMNVLPRPDATSASGWLPANQVTLQETWRPEKATLHAGEPLTRHLHLSALGLTGAQLPDLSAMMPVPDGFKAYPDKAKTDDALGSGGIVGTRDQDIALIANAPGHYAFAPLKLAWWDAVNRVQRQVELPGRSVEVLPAIAGTGAAPHDAPAAAPTVAMTGNAPATQSAMQVGDGVAINRLYIWQGVSAVLALLWLGTSVAWWRARGRGAPATAAATPSPVAGPAPVAVPRKASAILAALQSACHQNDAQAARRHLLEWSAVVWPKTPPRGLIGLAERVGDARCSVALQDLDRACALKVPWQGDALAQAFANPPVVERPNRPVDALPDLYA